ncbi:hypothetical protein PFISCL1PPCAC_19637, partial [Pristionchus fissidentatus]
RLFVTVASRPVSVAINLRALKMDDGTYRPGLDMSHGFVKSIVKNQIDRDEYHRLMEERKEEYKKELSGSPRERECSRPAPSPMPAHIYVPPHRRRAMGEAGSSACKKRHTTPSSPAASGMISNREEVRIREKVRSQVKALGEVDISALKTASSGERNSSKALFKLNLAASGENHEIVVLSTDNPARLAKGLSRQYGLNESECRLLRETIESEIETRLKS